MRRLETDGQPIALGAARPPRRWRRLVAGLAFLVVAAAGSYAIRRETSLDRLPDIGAPFDLEKYGTVDIPDSENAFTYYRAAAARLQGNQYDRTRRPTWEETPQDDRDWFLANREAIDLWLIGTRKDRGVYHQPKSLRYETELDVVTSSLRTMLWLAELGALRDISLGKFEDAWGWYRGVLRSSRHCGMHGTFVERLIGSSIYTQVARPIRVWAENPKVGASELRKALDELIAINAITAPLGQNFRAEYFSYAAILDDLEASEIKIKKLLNDAGRKSDKEDRPGVFERFRVSAWQAVLREPERSRRVFRLIWANWLSVGEMSVAERADRRRTFPQATLYDAPGSTRSLDPDELYRRFKTTRLLWLLLPAIENIEKVEEREYAFRASLVVDLAVQLYKREYGHGPPTIETLVGLYLKAIPPGYVLPDDQPSNGAPQ